MKIYNRYTGQLMHEDLGEVIGLHALWLKGDPSGVRADMRGANMTGAKLTGANMTRAILIDAVLSGADMRGANMTGAVLIRANMTGAILTDANLRRVALRGAILTDAKIDYQIQEGLLEQIAQIVTNEPEKLEMNAWHCETECGTFHCIAGWACALNPVAKALEKTHEPEIAGLLTLGAEAHSHFFDTNKDALDYLRGVLGK